MLNIDLTVTIQTQRCQIRLHKRCGQKYIKHNAHDYNMDNF